MLYFLKPIYFVPAFEGDIVISSRYLEGLNITKGACISNHRAAIPVPLAISD